LRRVFGDEEYVVYRAEKMISATEIWAQIAYEKLAGEAVCPRLVSVTMESMGDPTWSSLNGIKDDVDSVEFTAADEWEGQPILRRSLLEKLRNANNLLAEIFYQCNPLHICSYSPFGPNTLGGCAVVSSTTSHIITTTHCSKEFAVPPIFWGAQNRIIIHPGVMAEECRTLDSIFSMLMRAMSDIYRDFTQEYSEPHTEILRGTKITFYGMFRHLKMETKLSTFRGHEIRVPAGEILEEQARKRGLARMDICDQLVLEHMKGFLEEAAGKRWPDIFEFKRFAEASRCRGCGRR
jgi:hypothetical protein